MALPKSPDISPAYERLQKIYDGQFVCGDEGILTNGKLLSDGSKIFMRKFPTVAGLPAMAVTTLVPSDRIQPHEIGYTLNSQGKLTKLEVGYMVIRMGDIVIPLHRTEVRLYEFEMDGREILSALPAERFIDWTEGILKADVFKPLPFEIFPVSSVGKV